MYVEKGKEKAHILAIIPSGVLTYRDEASLLAHTHLVQFDTDLKNNKHICNYSDLKEQIASLPFVAYCGLSHPVRTIEA